MKILILSIILLSQTSHAFVLLNPKYELNDPTTAKVKVSAEGCTGNGVSDAEIVEGIKWAIEFWNDVPESRLKLSYGGKSSATLTDPRIPKNEIIVGCGALASVQILGATQHDRANGSARVIMNSAVYTGSYNKNSFIGTMTHEIGHGVGLFHSNDPASVMTYASHQWVDKPTYISQDDMDGVIYLYPNEKQLGGLLGSCSSFAAEKTPTFNFFGDFLLGFLAMLAISVLLRKGLRKILN
jgi:hypothetical protein